MEKNWEHVQSLFLEAADLDPDEQARFLESACSGDEELRREVGSLLAHDSAGEGRITEALGDTAQSLFSSENLIDTRLGAWRVLQEIGRGGMGAVYLAARDDDQFQKRVAIKVVKRGMDTVELLNSFRRERQNLAHLDHPYIARLIDGGSTPQGQPFLVMEYVEGKPIDLHCREQEMEVEARCRLFLKVCQAVSYAHRKLVIHRDLKPSNILVTTDGSPKLLDFGVAKLLDPELESGSAVTLQVGRPLTPEYASPEQDRGEPVGTASDVYALGAILYELLTGVKAQRMETYSPAELERVICDTEIVPPSERIKSSNARLRKRISGDLDNIVRMAMRKEPELRYSSVDLLAVDVSRYLRARPVTARPPSLGYRLGKFARRTSSGWQRGVWWCSALSVVPGPLCLRPAAPGLNRSAQRPGLLKWSNSPIVRYLMFMAASSGFQEPPKPANNWSRRRSTFWRNSPRTRVAMSACAKLWQPHTSAWAISKGTPSNQTWETRPVR